MSTRRLEYQDVGSAPVEVNVAHPLPVVIDAAGGAIIGGVTVADGADVAEGALADAVVAAGAIGSISAKLRRATQGLEDLKTGIVLAAGSAVIGTVGNSSVGFSVATTITRPANQTPYTAGDVLGGALDLGVLGPSAGKIVVLSVQLEIDVTAIPAGMTSFNLYLYNVTPPSAVADNGVFDIPAGDRASFLGKIAIGTPVDEVSTLYIEQNGINKDAALSGTHLFAYLVTVGGFTPAANSEVYVLTLHTISK